MTDHPATASAAVAVSAGTRAEQWGLFALRGVKTALGGMVIAVCLWAISSNSFATTLVYSLCISLMCWLFIDLARAVVASRLYGTAPDFPSANRRWPGWSWMAGIVVTGGVLGYAAGNEIANRLTGLNLPGPLNASLPQTVSLLVLSVVPAIVITYFFHSREVIATQRAEVERAERQAAEQQLKLLESQLEPHMLFNTLANLRVLIAVDPLRAQAMLDRLIAFLRASLAGSRASTHSLAAEFDRLRDYLGLMEVRMGARLATRFTLPEALAAAQVPPMLLQPIVENSIKHGLEPKREGGRIEIEAAPGPGDAQFTIRIRDTGLGLVAAAPLQLDTADRDPGVRDAAGGFGLLHVRERLATLYGNAASFELQAIGDGEGGTLAMLRLPLQRADAQPARGSSAR